MSSGNTQKIIRRHPNYADIQTLTKRIGLWAEILQSAQDRMDAEAVDRASEMLAQLHSQRGKLIDQILSDLDYAESMRDKEG